MTRSSKSQITFIRNISDIPMTQAEYESTEDLLARLVARAIAIDEGLIAGNGSTKGDDER